MEQIISRDTIRARARRAFASGVGRDGHQMNWNAEAVRDWQDEWDRQYAAWTQRAKPQQQLTGARA